MVTGSPLADGGPYVNAVTHEYFSTLGTRIVRGRGFLESDDVLADRVAVVSQTFARIIWRGDDPIGKCMLIGADTVPCTTVVGVAQDARRQSLTDDAPVMQYYVPLGHEMGVRVALGARGADVARLVVTQTLRVIGIGLALGLLIAVVAGHWIEPMLFQVSARDPAVLAFVVGTLLGVGTLASVIPARRAARVSPAEVLKVE